MKKFLFPVISASVLVLSSNVFAFGGGKHHDRGEHGPGYHKMLEQKLDLTDAQKAELATLRESMKSERGEHRRGEGGLRNLDPSAPDYDEKVTELAKQEAEQAEARFLRKAQMQAKVHAILTPEQRDQLKALQAEKAQRWTDKHAQRD